MGRKKKQLKPLKQQLTYLKGRIAHLLSFELLFDFEEEVLEDLYELISSILLERVDSKYYTVEEVADTRIMEYCIILEASTNVKVLELVRILKDGLNW